MEEWKHDSFCFCPSLHYIIGSSIVLKSWSETELFRMPASRSLLLKVQKNILASEQVLVCQRNVKNNNDKRVEKSSMTVWHCQSSLGWILRRFQGLNYGRCMNLAICLEFPIAYIYKISPLAQSVRLNWTSASIILKLSSKYQPHWGEVHLLTWQIGLYNLTGGYFFCLKNKSNHQCHLRQIPINFL